ncbi:GDP-mannose 4,6-dehydratase [Amycolatopsis cihanbeyliensis]|uniref:GDP-mannose 4,6-dehydratase n=1 Tax=Amycolatopsis cihanbeyliensis TaxID=1128664 RepID=A0A542DBH4_AMYCI|nr:GDP-mannose 4,6-dehydratase [Amycolatopsis cihanbeyliensis]TQJ00395.1 GDPmannose 4,6-dehydratase [Amycolatopsis cihanbeyliensis]
MSKRALITGITGQDGSYLAEYLLGLDYQVWGLVTHRADPRASRIGHLMDEVCLLRGDLTNADSLVAAVDKAQPDEVYNLAAMSFVPLSWQQAELAADVNGMGVLRMLEAIRLVSGQNGPPGPGRTGDMRFYQASSSEMFGNAAETPQHETTPPRPRSPYGAAKAYGHLLTGNYRDTLGMYTVSGIMFNHESPRRRPGVARKISLAVARIKLGHQDKLHLDRLDARRDWGYAGDYVRAMHLALQQESAADYVIGTGHTHSVRDMVRIAFAEVGLDWRDHVTSGPGQDEAAETDLLRADAVRARSRLGWRPTISFEELVRMMVDSDLRRLAGDRDAVAYPRTAGQVG